MNILQHNYKAQSWLCGPTMKSEFIQNILNSDAHVALFDLEDSVPNYEKFQARLNWLDVNCNNTNKQTSLRINSLNSYEGIKDIDFLVKNKKIPDIIVVPKIFFGPELFIIRNILQDTVVKKVKLFAVIETRDALKNIDYILENGFCDGVILGIADLCSDLGMKFDSNIGLQAKKNLGYKAKLNNIIAIDSPCFSVDDIAMLKHECIIAKNIGYSGKIAIHPSQVAIINQIFSYEESELERYRSMIDTYENSTSTIIKFENEIVGPPMIKLAKNVIKSYSK